MLCPVQRFVLCYSLLSTISFGLAAYFLKYIFNDNMMSCGDERVVYLVQCNALSPCSFKSSYPLVKDIYNIGKM